MSEFDRMTALEAAVPGFKIVRADSGMLPVLAAAFMHAINERDPGRRAFMFETPERRQTVAEFLDAHDYRRDPSMGGSWVAICGWSHFVPDVNT